MPCRHLITLAALLFAAPLLADTPRAQPSCMNAEVNGYRSQSYECLGQLMAAPEDPRHKADSRLSSERIIQRQPNQLGLFNQAATRLRMGSNFGNAVTPQLPTTP